MCASSCVVCVHLSCVSGSQNTELSLILILASGQTILILGSESWSRAAVRGGLLGWLERNGFAMETAGKGKEKEASGRAGEISTLYSERVLIKRHYEELNAPERIDGRCD